MVLIQCSIVLGGIIVKTIFTLVSLSIVALLLSALIAPLRNVGKKRIESLISSETNDNRKIFLKGLASQYDKGKSNGVVYSTANMSDEQQKSYKNLCLAYERLCACDVIWQIMSRTINTNNKSSASYTVDRKEVEFQKRVYNNVSLEDSQFVPSFRVGVIDYYIYPHCVVKAMSATDFELLPMSDVQIEYDTRDFIEDPRTSRLPQDADFIEYTYERVNKDGTPDLRFRDNRELPMYQYGSITIDKFHVVYMTSDYKKAKMFVEAFAEYKNAMSEVSAHQDSGDNVESMLNVSDIKRILENKKRQSNIMESTDPIFSATEIYFKKAYDVSILLNEFYDKLLRNKRIMRVVDETIDGGADGPESKLRCLFMYDLIKCYTCLGHDANDLFTTEGLPMFLVEGHTLVSFDITYTSLHMEKLRRLVEGINKVNMKVKETFSKSTPEDFFYLNELFKSCDSSDLSVQYFSLLYRFFSVIAKADDHISIEEGKWLERLMSYSSTSKDYGLDAFEKKAGLSEKQIEGEQPSHVDEDANPFEELQNMIGLSEVKSEITALANFVKIQQERKKNGLKTVGMSYHCVFTGNPGTGKTTVARILAEIYKSLGILKKGHLVETDRSGLVAEYVGQTAVKTNNIIDSALDGVLFIDEAYSLVQGDSSDYGAEAVSTLLKRMEDDRDRLVVVLAGYSEDMKHFIDSNPGLQSRFNRYIHFSDYTIEELKQIFLLNVNMNQYVLGEEGQSSLIQILNSAVENKDKNFDNGRYVRNLFEKAIQNQAVRLSCQSKITAQELSELKPEDLPLN